MSEYKRIRKKNQGIQEMDRFGVTRIKNGWWIRLGWRNKKPRFQQVVWDKEFGGNHIESYRKAVTIADEKKPHYKSEFRQPTNLIKGVALCKQRSKTKTADGKSIFYYCWKYAYMEDRKPKGRTFSFWKTGQIYESFLQMIGFALGYDPDIDLSRIDEYFLTYLNEADEDFLQTFLPRSDIRMIDSFADKQILKKRYLHGC